MAFGSKVGDESESVNGGFTPFPHLKGERAIEIKGTIAKRVGMGSTHPLPLDPPYRPRPLTLGPKIDSTKKTLEIFYWSRNIGRFEKVCVFPLPGERTTRSCPTTNK